MLGNIEYLARGPRSDLVFSLSNLSQYSKDPKKILFQAVKRVLRHFQGPKNYKLRNKES